MSWRLQVTNTGTEELIHGGERGHLTVKKQKTLHSCIESTHTHTHTHTRSQSHSCKNKKLSLKCAKKRSLSRAAGATADERSRRSISESSIVHHGSAYQVYQCRRRRLLRLHLYRTGTVSRLEFNTHLS